MSATSTKKRQATVAKPALKATVKKGRPQIVEAKPKAKPKAKHPTPEEISSLSNRYAIQDAVAAGTTIGAILEAYGNPGLRSIARHLRFGRYQVVGIKADAAPHLDPIADQAVAMKLAKMRGQTPIKQLVAPPRRK